MKLELVPFVQVDTTSMMEIVRHVPTLTVKNVTQQFVQVSKHPPSKLPSTVTELSPLPSAIRNALTVLPLTLNSVWIVCLAMPIKKACVFLVVIPAKPVLTMMKHNVWLAIVMVTLAMENVLLVLTHPIVLPAQKQLYPPVQIVLTFSWRMEQVAVEVVHHFVWIVLLVLFAMYVWRVLPQMLMEFVCLA